MSSIGNEEGGFAAQDERYSNVMRYNSSTGGERLGLIPSLSRSDRSQPSSSQPPGSPGGSIGSGSNVSQGSGGGRSVKSIRSMRSAKDIKQPIERLASC